LAPPSTAVAGRPPALWLLNCSMALRRCVSSRGFWRRPSPNDRELRLKVLPRDAPFGRCRPRQVSEGLRIGGQGSHVPCHIKQLTVRTASNQWPTAGRTGEVPWIHGIFAIWGERSGSASVDGSILPMTGASLGGGFIAPSPTYLVHARRRASFFCREFHHCRWENSIAFSRWESESCAKRGARIVFPRSLILMS